MAGYNLDDIKKLDAGDGQKIPLLHEVLDLADKSVAVNIELKGAKTAKPVAAEISKYLNNHGWNEEQFLVSSVSKKELKLFKKLMPNIKIGTIISRKTYLTTLPNVVLELNHIYERQIKKAHRKGIKVYIFTINTKKELEKVKQLGIDGIFTDNPGRFRH